MPNPNYRKQILLPLLIFAILGTSVSAQNSKPNILLIIADDMGIDVTNGYQQNAQMPVTPHLDSLQMAGVKFTNTWSAPQCTPSRAAIMSGKYGINTGVMRPPGNLDLVHQSIFNKISEVTSDAYATAVIGKWHINNTDDYTHPTQHGVDHYEGVFGSSVTNYYDWTKVNTDGTTAQVTEYTTEHFTDNAIDWVGDQTEPWFLWLAHVAPHSPFHTPPSGTYTSDVSSTQGQYLAAIESMDYHTGRLLDSMTPEDRANTIIIFVGDNGTPNARLQFYPNGHGKSSLYEGGVRVPMTITGKGVTRTGATEDGLTQITDIYATILELLDVQLPGGVHNSLSLKPALSTAQSIDRLYNYTDYEDGSTLTWAIRTDQYKLIEDENGNQEFYDLAASLLEEDNLINNLTTDQATIKAALEAEASIIRSGWSCNDGIQNGTETGIDACNDNCTNDNTVSTDNIGCCSSPAEPSVFYEFIENGERKIYANNFPNHDFCHTNNNTLEQKYHEYSLTKSPTIAATTTSVLRENGRPARFFGVAKNGVKFAPAPATPFIFDNTVTGEYNWDWVFEPTNAQGDGMDLVALDCSSGHVGPQGYHYHGNMFQYIEGEVSGLSTTDTPPDDVPHIGWASDGFPVLYRFGPDENGNLKELLPSFQLKSGLRTGDGISAPCGAYSGKYTNDYEYLNGKGDLDECNGIARQITLTTADGMETFDYFYVITASFPQISRCMVGTPSPDFDNSADLLSGTDADNDGFIAAYDCNDQDASINPIAAEIEGNDIDENCDGSLTTTGLRPTPADLGMTISPNPSDGSVRIACDQSCQLEVELFSITGQLITRQSGFQNITLSDIPRGVYIAEITMDNDQLTSAKLIVR